jgi:hypothetical protein
MGICACDDDVAPFVFEARIVDGDGGNPVADTDATTLRIGILEGELPVRELEFPITDGQFEAELEFASFSSVTRLRAEMEGSTTELITAPPAFVPSTTSGFLKVVAAEPSSCALVAFNTMESPRASLGMVQSGTFALLAGGTTQSNDQVEFLDALEWESRLFTEDFSLSFLGPTRAATVGEGQILVLPTDAGPFVFDMLNASQRVTQVVLHSGAGPQSGLVSIPGVGAMVIGGEASGVARARVSLVEPGGAVTSLQLSEPRSGPVATAFGEDVLVVGGDGTGSAELLLAGFDVGQPVAGVADGVRTGGLLVGDGQSRALLIGGAGATSTVRQDTLSFEGCPAACAATPGPTWSSARLRAIAPEGGTLVIGGDSSSTIEQVLFADSGVSIGSVTQLNVPRAAAGAIVYESGAFVVGGGDDENGARDDFEFCVPAALEPL